MRLPASVLLCTALLSLASSLRVQAQSQDWTPYFGLNEVLLRGSTDPNLDGALASPQPKLILEATDGSSRAKARVGVEVGEHFVLDLQLESPKTPGETTLATLDGLTDSTTTQLGFTWILWNPKGYTDKMPDRWKSLLGPAVASSAADAVAALNPADYQSAIEASREALKHQFPMFLTARAKTGQNDFRFVDASTLRSRKETHTSRELTAEFGAYVAGRAYTSLSYSRAKTFAAGRTADLCSPFGSTAFLECKKLIVEPPKEMNTDALAFEFRRLFKVFGFAARLKHDLENDISAVEIPIYFLQKLSSSKMELNGGVAVKWRSDTNDYSVSVFIGPALSTVFQM